MLAALIGCRNKRASIESSDIAPDEPSPLAVCTHMEALRAKQTPGIEPDDTCSRRVMSYALLDGRTLWMLRGRCILDAASVDEYLLCNRANHPDWPSAHSRASDEQLDERLRALEAASRRDAMP